MKDVIIKDCGHTVGAGIVTINNKKIYFTSYYKVLSEVYNEMTDSNMSFNDLLNKFIGTCNSDDRLHEIITLCENKLKQKELPKSKDAGDK